MGGQFWHAQIHNLGQLLLQEKITKENETENNAVNDAHYVCLNALLQCMNDVLCLDQNVYTSVQKAQITLICWNSVYGKVG